MSSGTTSPSTVPPVDVRPDYPFYDDRPVRIAAGDWGLLLAAVAVGMVLDLVVDVPGPTWLATFVRGSMLAGVPLVALAILVPRYWTALFRRVRLRDVGTMVGVAVVSLLTSAGLGVLSTTFLHVPANPMVGALADVGPGERALTFLAMVPQLLGEELFTIVPLLAVLTLLHRRTRLSRTAAVRIASLAVAVVFALVHLPAYGGNLLHVLVVIGGARLVLLAAFHLTKNVWVSTGAHVLNDWALFGLGVVLAAG